MALNPERNFVDAAEEAEARHAARRISVIGALVALVIGFVLVSLLLYGRILTDNSVVELTAPPPVTVPQAPAAPNAP